MILLKIAGKPVWWEILIMVPFVNIVICPTRPFPLTDHVRDGVHSGPSSPRRLSGRRGEYVRLADMEVNLSRKFATRTGKETVFFRCSPDVLDSSGFRCTCGPWAF